jgi:GH15 family glucan-1,4-alpha-glucosidase
LARASRTYACDDLQTRVRRESEDLQSFGSSELDASLLLLPIVGFLPPNDPRICSTVSAIEQELMVDGFVMRYRTSTEVDGLPPGEGLFLPCSFWLADNYTLQNRHAEARALFERLMSLRNDVGLLAEEYDPRRRRLVGNFPQAFSHVPLIRTALNLQDDGPALRCELEAMYDELPQVAATADLCRSIL